MTGKGKIIFDDGTDTSNYLRTELYPKTVEMTKQKQFKDLDALLSN